MTRRVALAAVATLTLHLAIFAWLWVSKPPPPAAEPVKVVIELQEPPQVPHSRAKSSVRKAQRPIERLRPRVQLEDLSPTSVALRTGTAVADRTAQSSPLNDENALDDPQGYSLSAKSYDQGNAIRGFLEAVHARINNRLIFDSIFAQYGHFGAVFLEFSVDHRGVVDASSLRASARDKILKVHVLRSALLPGLATPLKENLWLEDRPAVQLRARFEFLKGSVEQNLFNENPEKIAGMALSFRRYTPEVKVARTLGGHLVNGGINYDLFAMYDSWEKYLKARERRRLDTDPFSVHRADEYYNL